MPKLELYNDHNENVEPIFLATLESEYIPAKGTRLQLNDQIYEVNGTITVIDYAGTQAASLRVIVKLYPRGLIRNSWDIYRPKLAKDLVTVEWMR